MARSSLACAWPRAALGLIAIALALPATAFQPEFLPGRVLTWPGASPTYRVNALSFTAAGLSDAAVSASFNAWSNDPIAVLDASRGTNITGQASIDGASDGINEVEFITSGWSEGSGVLGVTFVYFNGANNILEADMYMNGRDFQWSSPTGAGCSNRFDLAATVTHEAGHFFGLGHSSESDATCNTGSPQYDAVLCDATMYYSGGPCDTSGQTLECDDKAGIRYLYPPGGNRRADWTPQAFSANPPPGAINTGVTINITGSALNAGSVSTLAGVAAVYVTTAAGSIAGGTRVTTTDPLAATGTCRTDAVALSHAFTAAQTGTRWLVVKLDDTGTTTEYDESDASNLVSLGPYTVASAGPALVVDPSTLEFDAAEGGAAPPSQAVSITNGGGGTFTWTATDDRAWISLSRTTGAPGQGFDVLIDQTGLAAGRHVGTITITAPGAAGSPATINVGLDLTAGAVLNVTPASLTFSAAPSGPLPAAQQLAISNGGTGTLSWTASDNQTWMSVAPGSGTNAGNVTVTITTTSMAAGTYNGTVTITATGAGGSPKQIPVTYTIAVAPPALQVSPSSLAFAGPVGGAAPPSQALSVTNGGGGTLSFTTSVDRTWLSASPGSGSAPATVTVSVNTAGLGAGTHSGNVTITSTGTQGSPAVIPVTLTLSSQPAIGLVPTTLTFTTPSGSSPASKTFTVSNTGTGTLTYAISDDAAWLSTSPAGTSLSSGASRQHQAAVDSASLPEGTYQATITVTAAGASNSPRTIPVTLEVGERPPLVVSPPAVSFNASPAQPSPSPASLTLSTSGASGAAWTAVANVPWLTISPAQGTGDRTITLTASSVGVPAGTHAGLVTITAPSLAGSPQSVDVTFTVAPGPRLAAAPSSFRWSATRNGALPSSSVLSISNAGTGTLTWSVSGAPFWLGVTPSSGVGAASVTLGPTTSSLPAGRHSATLVVSASSAYESPVAVTVTYDITGPAVALAPERVRFELSGGSFRGPSSASVLVGDSGGTGGSAFTAASNAPWLSVSPATGVVGDTLTVSLLQPERLPVGLHDAAIIVTAPGAANSPAPLPVSVFVAGAPGLAAFPQEVVLEFDGDVASVQVDEVSNRPGDWTIVSAPSWLVADATAGTHGGALGLRASASGLPATAHAGTLVLSAADETVTIPARLDLGLPLLAADPAAIALAAVAGGMSPSVTLDIAARRTSEAPFTASSPASWLVITPDAGAAPDSIQLRANAASLAAGTHSATLSLTPAGSPPTLVPVSVVVAPAGSPLASFTASELSGCVPLTVTFTDTSQGASSRTFRLATGETSTLAAPTFTFDEPGDHVVEMVATNASGSSTARRTIRARQSPLVHAGWDRVVAFEPDGETRLALEDARVAAAPPARIASLAWTTSVGIFEDSGTATSSLERPVLLAPTSRGGLAITLTVVATDTAGCLASDSATIRVRADVDLDGDTWSELVDNCPGLSNSLQGDQDGDGVGSTCDPCPSVFDPGGADADGSGAGDACEGTAARSAALSTAIGRACDGSARVRATVVSPGQVRRAFLQLGGRVPTSVAALAAGTAHGATARATSADPTRLELRAPAGFASAAPAFDVAIPIAGGDDIVNVPCVTAGLSAAGGDLAAGCTGGEVRLRPDADIAPAGAPDGLTNVADAVRALRASVGLESLAREELARADISPGSVVAGTWRAAPDCRVDVADVVIILRAVVGLVQIER